MRNKLSLFFCMLDIFTFLCSYNIQIFGQEKINISAGVGLPELLNIGVRYQLKQVQLGLGVGYLPLKDESVFSLSSDVYYHFGGSSKLSERRPWYGNVGFVYWRDETENFIVKDLFLNLCFGRDINISHKIGFEIDAGAMALLYEHEIRKKPLTGWELDFPSPIVLPSIGIRVFYRIYRIRKNLPDDTNL